MAPVSARTTKNSSAPPSVTVKLIATSPSLSSSRTSTTVANVALISSKPKLALIAKSSSCASPHVASAPSVMSSTTSSSPTRSDMDVVALISSKPKLALISKSSSCASPHFASAPSVMSSTTSSSPTRRDMDVVALTSSTSGSSWSSVQSQHLPPAIVPSQKPHDDESVAHQRGKPYIPP